MKTEEKPGGKVTMPGLGVFQQVDILSKLDRVQDWKDDVPFIKVEEIDKYMNLPPLKCPNMAVYHNMLLPEDGMNNWSGSLDGLMISFNKPLLPSREVDFPNEITMLYLLPTYTPPKIDLKPSQDNRDILQSYILTEAMCDLSVSERRIMLWIIEYFQSELAGKKLNKDLPLNPALLSRFNLIEVNIPLHCLLAHEKDENYRHVKKAIFSLNNKTFQYEDSKVWKTVRLIELPRIDKYSRTVSFCLHQEFYEAFMKFSKGYRKYELKTMLSLGTSHSMRSYELVAVDHEALERQNKRPAPVTYSIEHIKAFYGVEDKYRNNGKFIIRVIETSKRELDQKSPCSFKYELEPREKQGQPRRKKITGITIFPVYHPEHRDPKLAERDERRSAGFAEKLPEVYSVLSELKNSEGKNVFNEQDLLNLWNIHSSLFENLYKAQEQGMEISIQRIADTAILKNNPTGYLIDSLKNEWNKLEADMAEKEAQAAERSNTKQQEIDTARINEEYIRGRLKGKAWMLPNDKLDKAVAFVIAHGGQKYLVDLDTKHNADAEKKRSELLDDMDRWHKTI